KATTRALDASVEAARQDALAGRYERASQALAEAVVYGRPRARGLRDQIHLLLGETYMVYFRELMADPLYALEVLPVPAAEHVQWHWVHGSLARDLAGTSNAVRASADERSRQCTRPPGCGAHRRG